METPSKCRFFKLIVIKNPQLLCRCSKFFDAKHGGTSVKLRTNGSSIGQIRKNDVTQGVLLRILTNLDTANFSTNCLGECIDKLDETRIFVGRCYAFDVLLDFAYKIWTSFFLIFWG